MFLKWFYVFLIICCSRVVQAIAVIAVEEFTPSLGPSVQTPSGTIRGAWLTSRRGRRFQAFRGVRYAEPPTGQLRFQPPQLIKAYLDEVNASEEGPSCPLNAPASYNIDEDCLMLNVYTPGNIAEKSLPVIVFIHSGGFYSMNGRSDIAGPHYLLDRDLVLVTFNYRVGSLGFLSTGDELAPGNNGFKDQVAALQWVQRNIAAFGGDPQLVTLAGAGAGSISVMLHMVSKMSEGLFHRAISMSGSPLLLKGPLKRDLKDIAIKQAQLLNCPWESSQLIVDCLKSRPWREFAESTPNFFEFGSNPLFIWTPVVERDFGQTRFLHVDPVEAIKHQQLHAVPWIISQTTHEFYYNAFAIIKNDTNREELNRNWNYLAPICFLLPDVSSTKSAALRSIYLSKQLALSDSDASADGLGRLYRDAVMRFPVHRLANLMSRFSPQPVWYYEFAYVGDLSHFKHPNTNKPIGAMHHDDLIYLFTMEYRFPAVTASDNHTHMVDKMTAIWYNFARYGNPNTHEDTPELASLRWPTLTTSTSTYLRIDKPFSVHSNLFEDNSYKLWEELYPINYKLYRTNST